MNELLKATTEHDRLLHELPPALPAEEMEVLFPPDVRLEMVRGNVPQPVWPKEALSKRYGPRELSTAQMT
jgi:hypothetical protein